jgi:transcriptional regulator with XRE-family HTH domain
VAQANARLRDAIVARSLTTAEIAGKLGVDRKSVERWITPGRVPYAGTRHRLATLLGQHEAFLWPDALTDRQREAATASEIVRVYPHRASVPSELWQNLFTDAAERIEILVYSGIWVPDQFPRLGALLREKAEHGVTVRILLGEPESPEVAVRGAEEGIGDALAGKVRNVLVHYRELAGVPNVEVRLHATTLYNSIYRFDEQLMANTHLYGFPAAHAPVLHLRRLSSGVLFQTYSDSYEKVWATGRPAWPEGV